MRAHPLLLALCLIVAAADAFCATAPGACRQILVSNEASGDIAVVDPASARVVATIPVGKRPRGMALSPDRDQLFVALSGTPAAPPGANRTQLPQADSSADGIGVVDLSTRQLERTIKGVSDPERVAISSDGKKLFVASEDQGEVLTIDVDSGAILARTPVGAEAEGVDLSPGGIRVYATSEAENRLTVIDAHTGARLTTIGVGLRPRSTAFSHYGMRAYVANEASATVSVVDTSALRVLRNLALPEEMLPMRVAVPPSGTPLYVSTGRGRMIVALDARSGRVVARAESGARPWDLAMSPDGKELYAANGPSNDVSVFAIPGLRLRARIHTGERPWGVVCRDEWWRRAGISRSTYRGLVPAHPGPAASGGVTSPPSPRDGSAMRSPATR